MLERQFADLVNRVESASSYAEIMSLTSDPIISFDQRVRLEDICAHAFTALLRESDDRAFAHKVRQVNRDKPRWLKLIKLSELVREELDLRFLIAKLPRMGEVA